jgi:hypothetical protein
MGIALQSKNIAGVIASSAGFPDSQPRKTVPFAVFGTAGVDDFNYLEMREVDRALTSPHRVAIFDGGHTWLSSELAVTALEWMELQAVKSGIRPADPAFIDAAFARRAAAAETYRALEELVADFRGLRDVSEYAARAAELARRKDVKEALKRERADERTEAQIQQEIAQLLREPGSPRLRELVLSLSHQLKTGKDAASRSLARRVLSGLSSQARSIKDPELRKLMEQVRPPNPFQ